MRRFKYEHMMNLKMRVTKSCLILLKVGLPKEEKNGPEVACQGREGAHHGNMGWEDKRKYRGKSSFDSSEHVSLPFLSDTPRCVSPT